jgi:hypothetical protein
MARSNIPEAPTMTPELDALIRRVGKSYAKETAHMLDTKKGMFRSTMHAGFTQARGDDNYRSLCKQMGLTDTGYKNRNRNMSIIVDFARGHGSDAGEEMAQAVDAHCNMDRGFSAHLRERNIPEKISVSTFREFFRYMADVKKDLGSITGPSTSAPPAPPQALQ